MENKIAVGSLAQLMAQTSGKSKKFCDDFLREFFRVVSEALQEGEYVKIKGFGTFKLTQIESRTSVNVNTGEPQEVASYKKVVFTPAKDFAATINAPFEEFESIEIEEEFPDDFFEENGEPAELNDTKETDKEDKFNANIINENLVSENSLELGSNEEAEDDEITYEAYKEEEEIQDPVTLPIMEDGKDTSEIHQFPVYPHEERKSRFGIGFLVGTLSTLVVCVVIFMLGCFFDWWPVNFGSPKEVEVVEPLPQIDTMEGVVDEAEIPEKEVPVYDTVSTTRYLTTIAREHYGNFNFWPYIYMENENILGHPDRITPGTQVVVPDLSKYGVDSSNKEDIEKAKKKAIEIYSRFK